MGNGTGIFLCILIAIVLAVLILWCADVLAHDSDTHKNIHVWFEYKHAHYLDGNVNDGYFNYQWHTHPNALRMPWDHSGLVTSESYQRAHSSQEVHRASLTPPPPPPPPPPPRQPSTTTYTEPSTSTVVTTIEESLDTASDILPEDIEVPEPEDEEQTMVEPESCVEELVERVFYRGYTLYTPTVVPEGVETLADLWELYWWTGETGGAFYVVVDSTWLVYRGSGDVGDLPIGALYGIIVHQSTNPTLASLTGCPVEMPAQIQLKAGLNLIGFPKVPASIQRPSDLLSAAVYAVIVVQEDQFKEGVAQQEQFKGVFRAGDPGDELLHDGQGLLVLASEASTISLSVAQAPMAQRTLTATWGAIKQQ